MRKDLPPLKDNYGPCERLLVDCYLHKEQGSFKRSQCWKLH